MRNDGLFGVFCTVTRISKLHKPIFGELCAAVENDSAFEIHVSSVPEFYQLIFGELCVVIANGGAHSM